ncbi:signal transduction histidine kinase/CheY-like chemotaxis protein [Aquimarina sp. EL_43]|uniref:hybrid sensor histidine kinase/response regulator n=1 Tax=unclassified Aquimarina TaxID=2627091 RepID=UPI0018C97DF4|nr:MULTISPECIES: ATP-binding protein [unclassified Aquimarina]MBG6131956.1 signal transduction histidine kinase/CheY-like chemotaxis protein [Aquimarina sp. EL_35]MBG6149520.1 signal transduction histidine kinase/CheY-like chemotaxis protein [Aquimarina sp. EL_32]MBG6170217.1 signal transduction histidine kinase/CheY-like chemotaxis protein [Aquimarina sp. EL_43]
MKNTKRSVTFKIIAGYLLAGLLAVTAFWVIYQQLGNYTQITEIKNQNNEKLFLVGETITGLYEAESLTRNIIQTSDVKKFITYKAKIDTILKTINQVSEISDDTLQTRKIDSIKHLIDSKNKNLEELIKVYEQRKQKGLYETAIDELEKVNKSFGGYTKYDIRFKKYDPRTRRALINILELTKQDNAKRLTNQTVDSLATSVKQVLAELEQKDRKYRREITLKENNLLKKDQIITKQLRDLLASIERNERNEYFARLEASNQVLNNTADIIVVIAAISLLIAIIFLFLITKDVSKSQKYRNELEAEKTYTESLLKTRESLINTVTHDLRSPLNTVIGYSDLLERTGLDNKQKHYLDHLKKSSDYILHLVNDLLDLSKLEAGRMVIEELPFSPQKLIENTISSVIPINDKKNLDIRIITDPQLKKQYLGDPFRIKQVLTNLVNNAYKFTNEGSITIDSKVIENGLSEKQLVISVIDTGIGITKEQQHYIFEEFSQGDDNTEKKYGGFGLGLAITKKIIKLLKGKIELESELNVGSKFTFYIPFKQSGTLILEEESEVTEIQNFTNKKVLIVDDDPSQLALTSEVATLAGLTYDICKNGIEAISLLQTNTYDLVLTDIQMPKMGGFELLQSIKSNANQSTIPVVALSGRTDTSFTEYQEAGFAASLRKPYAPKELIDLIAKVLSVDLTNYNGTTHNGLNLSNEQYSLNDLMLFAQGDSDSLYAILDTFYESTIDNVKELKMTIKKKDIYHIKKIAHKMLPMFKQIKAKEVVPILEKLEHPDQYHLNKKAILNLTNDGIEKIEDLIDKLKVEN